MSRNESPYRMPEVLVGDTVLWSHAPGSDVAPAVVTAVGPFAISVTIFPENSRGGLPRDGVRHVSDPALAKLQSEAGVWRHTERTLRSMPRPAAVPGPRRTEDDGQ